MSHPIPDKPSRSVFVSVLLVGVVVVGILLLAAFAPLADCVECKGTGRPWGREAITIVAPGRGGEAPTEIDKHIVNILNRCQRCEGKGKVPLLNIWRRE